jgi:phenylacetic acid degradation protein
VYSIEGVVPVIDPTAFVHPTAVLIGDVIIGPRCYVGPLACLRGDFGRLIMEEGANLQDTCVVHGFPGCDTVIEVDGHIGHGAVIHGARIGRNALVGMNAVVMDIAVIGESSIVAAMSFVKASMLVPPRSMVMGTPAKVTRTLSDVNSLGNIAVLLSISSWPFVACRACTKLNHSLRLRPIGNAYVWMIPIIYSNQKRQTHADVFFVMPFLHAWRRPCLFRR